jgi:hypothetical protein
MQDFNYLNGEYNTAGLRVIEFAPVDNVTAIPDAVDLKVGDEVTFTGISAFYQMLATIETGSLKYTQQQTDHGEMYVVEIDAFIPKLKYANDLNFELLKNQKLILVADDQNDNRRVVGSLTSPATFSIASGTGTAFKDRNGTSIKIYWETDHVPYYYDIPLPIGSGDIHEGGD